MIFLETSFLVNYFFETAENHKKSLKIMEKIKCEEVIISQMVIFETLNVLRKLKQSSESMNKVYKKLLEMEIYEDSIYYDKALKDTLTNNISFFDNLTRVVMTNNSIGKIATFDKDFDIFTDIKRVK